MPRNSDMPCWRDGLAGGARQRRCDNGAAGVTRGGGIERLAAAVAALHQRRARGKSTCGDVAATVAAHQRRRAGVNSGDRAPRWRRVHIRRAHDMT